VLKFRVKLRFAFANQVSLTVMVKDRTGTVVRSTGSWNTVLLDSGEKVECRLRGQFRTQELRTTNPVAVGDRVTVELDDNVGVITEIHERRNHIVRRSVNLSKAAHVIAANLDQAIMLTTVTSPRTSFGFIDRFLVVAEAYRIPSMVVFNKADLLNTVPLRQRLKDYEDTYRKAGYPVLTISARTGDGLRALKAHLAGRTTLVFGHSGVGKSTLLNALEPGLELRTGQISDKHRKGTHTTTFAEMFTLSDGARVIDTPGIKEFGLVNMSKEEIHHYFPDLFKASAQCRFNNCLHLEEPGCHVREVVSKGVISENRYSSYISIIRSLE